MIKIKKLSIAVVALLMCLLLGVTVWSADGNGVTIAAVADKTSFCTQDYAQTMTVTLKASEAIDVFSLEARLDLPDGWSASVSGLDGIWYEASSGKIAWIADTNSADNLNVNATELATIKITIPANAPAGDHVVSLTGIEVTKLLVTDGELNYQYWAKGTNLLTNVAIKEHVDETKDHKCDACNKIISECVDEAPKDHVCDYSGCKAAMGGEHKSLYPCKDGICVYCGQPATVINPAPHSDAEDDEDIACDKCGTEWSKVVFQAYDGKTFVVKDILVQVWEGEIPVCGAEVADYVENCITYTFAGWENGDEQYPIGTALPAIKNPVKDTAIVYRAYYTTDGVAHHSYNYDCDKNCKVCGKETRPAADHVYDNACDAECNVCKETREVGDHTIGTAATCKTVAICGECGAEYGATNPTNHASDKVTYTNNGENHSATYDCCGAPYVTNEGHTYTDGTCVCGKEEPVSNIIVTDYTQGKATVTISGQVVTVTYSSACKVGYWDETEGKYVAIPAAANGDGSYSFTAPAGVTEVILVVKGDVSLDGAVKNGDKTKLNAVLLKKTTLEAEAFFAADVSGDGFLKNGDKTKLNAILLKKTTGW